MKHILFISLLIPVAGHAEADVYSLIIKEHRFQPSEIKVPSGQKVKLLIENQDATPEEFDSYSLNREKLIAGKSQTTIYIGPLAPGSYSFQGEFNAKTAQGVLIAQ